MKLCRHEPCVRACVQAHVITALQMFSLDAVNASEFLEVYKGVVPPGEFGSMLDELTSGQLLFIHSLLNLIHVSPLCWIRTVLNSCLYLCSSLVHSDNAALHLSNTLQGGHQWQNLR